MTSRAEIAKRKAAAEKAWAYRLKRTYGITVDEYNAIKEAQGGYCAICQRANGNTRRLAVDHSHSTGLVRGLLCSQDNNIVGLYRDDPAVFRRGMAYLLASPAYEVIGYRKVPEK